MKLSKKFLNDYVNVENINFEEIANKMVLAGNEYESIKKLSDTKGLIVGHVLTVSEVPESKKLHLCMVDCGNGPIQIICGAPNVRENIKVIISPIGSTITGGFEIGKAKLAGYESNGMICSLSEIGIENKYQSEEDKNGIHILDDDAPIGEDAIKYLGLDDEIIDFDLTANRGDLLSVIGMAYEVGAILDEQVKLPTTDFSELNVNITDNHELKVETNNCSLYLAKKVNNVEIKESPDFIKNRLIASGIRPINNVVDISNYVMLEYGQPLHFFDADKLGHEIIIRMANDNEKVVTLDNIDRQLNKTDIVITNQKEVVALAGVMGGLTTEVESDTKNIIVEAAIFNPVNIRGTSRKIVRSESSMRFEKGLDPNRTYEAIKRAVYLLSVYANGEVEAGMLVHDTTDKEEKSIEITLQDINSRLGLKLDNNSVEEVLRRLAFEFEIKNDSYFISIPTRRMDISIKEDITEEVGRIVGYDNLEGQLPTLKVKKGSYSPKIRMNQIIRKCLNSLGLNQVINYSLIKEKDVELFSNDELIPIKLLDPLSEDRVVLRKSLMTSLIQNYEYNKSRNLADINIFEISEVYAQNDEKTKLGILMNGNVLSNSWQNKNVKVDFYTLKGIVEALISYLGLSRRLSYNKENLNESLHPGRSENILIDNEIIGYLGQIHPSINKDEIYLCEIDISKLMKYQVRMIKYEEPSKYPTIIKDMAFIVDKNVESIQILNILKRVGGRLVSKIDVFDIYVGQNIGENNKSIAYKITYSDPTKTLTEEEVMTIFNKMIKEVETNLEAKLRDK